MFRMEILWLACDPILQLQGRLVADLAEQARCLVTEEVLPQGYDRRYHRSELYRFSRRTVAEVVG